MIVIKMIQLHYLNTFKKKKKKKKKKKITIYIFKNGKKV